MFFCYYMGHETPWIARGTGEAPSPSHCLAERRQDKPVGGSAYCGSLQELRFSMVPGVPEGRIQGPSFKDDPGASSQAVSERERSPSRDALVRPAGRRVSHRPLDLETGCPHHPQALWNPVSSESRLAAASRNGLELPETRAQSFTKERGRNCAVEGLPVAPYKKKPKDLGPIWSSLMNRASCSFPISVAPGLQKGRLRSSITSTNRTGFPRSMRCRFPRKRSAWPFIFGAEHAILTAWTFVLFSKSCSSISEAPWFCCGTGEPSTGVKKSNGFSLTIRGFIWNTFQPMLLNLTPQNMSGIRPTAHSPIVHPRAWLNLRQCSKTRYDGSGDHHGSFGLASMLPISLGEDRSFHYLCENQ